MIAEEIGKQKVTVMDKSKDAIFVNIHVEHGGAAQVTQGPPGTRRDDSTPRATRQSIRAHLWKVSYRGKLYSVSVDAGAMSILLDGETVWRGERGPNRTYRAQWTKLDPSVERNVLELARSGDRFGHDDRAEAPQPTRPDPSTPRRRAPQERAPREPAPRSARNETTVDPPAAESPTEKPATRKPRAARAASKSGAPKPTAAKKTTAKKTSAKRKKAAAKAGTVEVAAHSRSAPQSKPPSKRAPAKAATAKKSAPKRSAPKAPQATTPREQRAVDDEKVMGELLRGLERDAPETAAAAYAALRKAWFNGAREAVLTWVKDNPAKKSLAKAYAEWAGANASHVHTLAAKAA